MKEHSYSLTYLYITHLRLKRPFTYKHIVIFKIKINVTNFYLVQK